MREYKQMYVLSGCFLMENFFLFVLITKKCNLMFYFLDNESGESGEDEHLAKEDKSEKVDESKDVASGDVQTDVPSKSFNPDR